MDSIVDDILFDYLTVREQIEFNAIARGLKNLFERNEKGRFWGGKVIRKRKKKFVQIFFNLLIYPKMKMFFVTIYQVE